MTGSTEERATALRKLIEEAAAQQQVPEDAVSLLDDDELGVLVKEKLTAEIVLQRTTYDKLVAAGVSRGAAEVLKMLFPGPTEGAGGAAGGSGAGGAAGGSAALERIEEGVALISRVLPIVMVSIKEQFGPPTTASRGSNASFRRSIMQYYGMTQQSGKLRCMVLDELLPKEFVCAGHLLACKHKAYSQVLLGFEDISDPRNGLLWNSAIEEVYELQQVCFSFIQGWTFRIHVIDKGLMDVKLGDVGKDKNNAAFKNLMADRTFRGLDNKVVEFRGRGGVGPFKRALAFQAMNALATQQARYPDHFNPGDHKFDYMSEFDGKDELIKAWLNDSHDNEYD